MYFMILLIMNWISFSLISNGFYDILDNYYLGKNLINDFFYLKYFLITITLFLSVLVFFINSNRKRKLNIINKDILFTNHSLKSLSSNVLLIILFHIGAILTSLFLNIILKDSSAFDKFFLPIIYKINLNYTFNYFILKFVYIVSELTFFYLVFHKNINSIFYWTGHKIFKIKKTSDSGRNIYIDLLINTLNKTLKNNLNNYSPGETEFEKFLINFEKQIFDNNNSEHENMILYSIMKIWNCYSPNKLNEDNFIKYEELKSDNLKKLFELFQEDIFNGSSLLTKNYEILFEFRKEDIEKTIDNELFEIEREIYLAGLIYQINYLSLVKNNRLDILLGLFERFYKNQYYIFDKKILHNIYPYHFLYAFKDYILITFSNVKTEMKKIEENYPGAILYFNSIKNIFKKRFIFR